MGVTILANDVTRNGLRRLHLLSDKPVELRPWLEEIPWEARDPEGQPSLTRFAREEEGLGAWHTWLFWHPRGDVVRVTLTTASKERQAPAAGPYRDPQEEHRGRFADRGRGEVVGIMWYVERGERMGEVLRQAAWRYVALFAAWPERALARELPDGAPERVVFDEGAEEGEEPHALVLEFCEWMPRRCVFVYGGEHGK